LLSLFCQAAETSRPSITRSIRVLFAVETAFQTAGVARPSAAETQNMKSRCMPTPPRAAGAPFWAQWLNISAMCSAGARPA
jgi:hypothetical protein